MDEKIRMKVLKALRRIPHGKATTYKHLAEIVGTSPRAVGKILSTNDEPDYYPCYKVIMSDGRVGGYTINNRNNRETEYEKIRRLRKDGINVKDGLVQSNFIVKIK